jgi:hypothetical protein
MFADLNRGREPRLFYKALIVNSATPGYLKTDNGSVKAGAVRVVFGRVALKPGERKTVLIPLHAKSLACWNTNRHSFVLESGKIVLLAGGSSKDVRLKKTITVNN